MFPYLMLNNSKAYFHAPNAEIEPCRIPSEGESFNPAKEHFGMLYDAVTQLGVKTDAFEYEVYYRPFGGKPNIPISKVRFGNSVSYYTIKSKVVNATRRNASSGTRKTSGRKIKRKYVWTDKDQIKRRIDGVIEVPRVFVARNNRHRYHTWTREYDNELKKEEDARRKWEILVRELEKEEAIERGDDNNVSDSNEFNLENGSIVYRLSEGM